MKAIYITPANVDMLASRFAVEKEDVEEVLPDGYYLITDFGNDEKFDTLTPGLFDATFRKVADIQNGFISIERI